MISRGSLSLQVGSRKAPSGVLNALQGVRLSQGIFSFFWWERKRWRYLATSDVLPTLTHLTSNGGQDFWEGAIIAATRRAIADSEIIFAIEESPELVRSDSLDRS